MPDPSHFEDSTIVQAAVRIGDLEQLAREVAAAGSEAYALTNSEVELQRLARRAQELLGEKP